MQLILLVVLISVLNTVGQVLLKQGAGRGLFNPYLIGGVGLYGVNTIAYVVLLSKTNLSLAYPVTLGLTITATTLSGVVLLGEKVSLLQWFGIGLVISGVSAIAMSQR